MDKDHVGYYAKKKCFIELFREEIAKWPGVLNESS